MTEGNEEQGTRNKDEGRRTWDGRPANVDGRFLGLVVGGSLTEGVDVKLDPAVQTEDVKVGQYVIMRGTRCNFFGMVTDIKLDASDATLRSSPPGAEDAFMAEVLSGSVAYGALTVRPMLVLPQVMGAPAADGKKELEPAKTVPAHFARALCASERDIQAVFGEEDDRHYWIGNPLDMETKVCLDLVEYVKRSNGVFGKSGTGKTFLTRLLLTGILQGDVASTLVFDMHSEYGWQGEREGGTRVKALKQLFPSKVAVFSLDAESSRRRGVSPDFIVRVGYDEIEPEDIELLRETLGLSEVAAASAYNLQRKFGKKGWVGAFLALDGNGAYDLAEELGVNGQALLALHNRLERFQRFGFMTPEPVEDSVQQIINYLDRGMHVVLEFGRYGNDLTAYMMVANLLTRRIHGRYVQRKEEAEADKGKEPRPLVIVIEEAHRFLNPQVSSQTIFGTIAREMRKYNVTLLVIDQRPSAIDSEVLSQIGTKISCLLDDERDVEAVLAGVSGGRELRSVLARLESKQQALIFGHALPVPVVVKTREYGSPEFYASIGKRGTRNKELGTRDEGRGTEDGPAPGGKTRLEKEIDELFGE